MKMNKMFVIPDQAKAWLRKAHRNNRTLRHDRVVLYAARMKAGIFNVERDQPNSQNVISFSRRGTLINGHTRLKACELAGVGFWAWIAKDVSEKEFVSTDESSCIAIRSLSDFITILCHQEGRPLPKNLACVAQAVKIVHHYRDGIFYSSGSGNQNANDPSKRGGLIPQYLDTWRREGARIEQAVKVCVAVRPVMSVGLAAAMLWGFQKRNEQQALQFFARLADGVGLEADDLVRALRQRLLVAKDDKSKRLYSPQIVEMCVRVWNKVRAGERGMKVPSLGGPYPVVK